MINRDFTEVYMRRCLSCENEVIEKCSIKIEDSGDDLDPLKVRKLYETVSISTSDVAVV